MKGGRSGRSIARARDTSHSFSLLRCKKKEWNSLHVRERLNRSRGCRLLKTYRSLFKELGRGASRGRTSSCISTGKFGRSLREPLARDIRRRFTLSSPSAAVDSLLTIDGPNFNTSMIASELVESTLALFWSAMVV